MSERLDEIKERLYWSENDMEGLDHLRRDEQEIESFKRISNFQRYSEKDIRYLLAEVERLTAERDALRNALSRMSQIFDQVRNDVVKAGIDASNECHFALRWAREEGGGV